MRGLETHFNNRNLRVCDYCHLITGVVTKEQLKCQVSVRSRNTAKPTSFNSDLNTKKYHLMSELIILFMQYHLIIKTKMYLVTWRQYFFNKTVHTTHSLCHLAHIQLFRKIGALIQYPLLHCDSLVHLGNLNMCVGVLQVGIYCQETGVENLDNRVKQSETSLVWFLERSDQGRWASDNLQRVL